MGLITGKKLQVRIAFDNYAMRVTEDSLSLVGNTTSSSSPDATKDLDTESGYDQSASAAFVERYLSLFSGINTAMTTNTGLTGTPYKTKLLGQFDPYTVGATDETINVVALPYSIFLWDQDISPTLRCKVKLVDSTDTFNSEVRIEDSTKVFEGTASGPFVAASKTEDFVGTWPIFWEYISPFDANKWEIHEVYSSVPFYIKNRGLFLGYANLYENVSIDVKYINPKNLGTEVADLVSQNEDTAAPLPRMVKVDFSLLTAEQGLELLRGVEVHGLRGNVFLNCYSGENSPREKLHTMLAKIKSWTPLKTERGNRFSMSITFQEDI